MKKVLFFLLFSLLMVPQMVSAKSVYDILNEKREEFLQNGGAQGLEEAVDREMILLEKYGNMMYEQYAVIKINPIYMKGEGLIDVFQVNHPNMIMTDGSIYTELIGSKKIAGKYKWVARYESGTVYSGEIDISHKNKKYVINLLPNQKYSVDVLVDPKYIVYQNDKQLKSFLKLEEAIKYAKKYKHSLVLSLEDNSLAWDSIPSEVYQKDKFLKEFPTRKEAITYAKKWKHSKVLSKHDGKLSFDFPNGWVQQEIDKKEKEKFENTVVIGTGKFRPYFGRYFNYAGEMKAGLPHGKGKAYEIAADGESNSELMVDGEFQKGLLNGNCTIYYYNSNNELLGYWKGKFIDGNPNGEMKYYLEDGTLIFSGEIRDWEPWQGRTTGYGENNKIIWYIEQYTSITY